MGLWIREEEQMSFMKYDLEKIVKADHPLRKIQKTINFKTIALEFKDILKKSGPRGYGSELGIRSLFLQFYYDLSDWEMEERLRYGIGLKWFYGLSIEEEIPYHAYFYRMRKTLGTERIGKVLRKIPAS